MNYVALTLSVILMLPFVTIVSAQPSFVVEQLEGYVPAGEKKIPWIEGLLQQGEAIKQVYPDSAIQLFSLAYSNSELLHYREGMATALVRMGLVYTASKGEPLKSLACFRKAYPYCLQANNKKNKLLFLWYNGMAMSFTLQGTFDSTMVYYYKALNATLQEDHEDKRYLAGIYNNIGGTFYDMQQYEKSLFYLEKARNISLQENLPNDLTTTYYILSGIFIAKEQPDSTLHYLKEIEKINPQMNDRLKQQLYCAYGVVYFRSQQYKKSIAAFKEALALKGGDSRARIAGLINMGAAYAGLNQYRESAYYSDQALEESLRSGISGQGLQDIYNNLAEIYDSLRDYRKAYHYKSLAGILKDSLSRMKNIKKFNELEDHYQAAQKDKELTAKQLELLIAEDSIREKNVWIGIMVAGGLILMISMITLFQKQRLQLQKAKTVRQKQRIEQLKAVIDGEEKEKSRIGHQLHDDIMVQLSIVKMGMEALPMKYPGIKDTEDYRNIMQQMDFTGQKIRQTAHNLMPDALLEEGLLSAIRYFCSNVAKMTQLKIHFQDYGAIPHLPLDTEISIYRMIQELIQNVIKHARAENALVQLNCRGSILSITIEDDGIGIQQGTDATENKMGLKSIRNRLKALQGTIDIHHCTPHGTSINIELNI